MKHSFHALSFAALLVFAVAGEARQEKPPAQPAPQPSQPQQKPRPAQPSRGGGGSTLTVEVTDKSGNGLADVRVAAAGPVDRSGETGQNGSIAFRSMRGGTYRLRFEHEGFTTLEREFVMRNQATTVSVALTAAPVKPAPAPEPPPAPEPKPERSTRVVEPRSLSLPDFLDKNLIGGEPQKETLLACAEGGTARLLQVRDPLDEQHADVDEVLYVVAGGGTVRMRNQDTKMSPGHFALVPRGTPHSLRREGRNPLILLSVLAGSPCDESALK
ncbi:MAG: carboxypeptidase regulatory-like domain-containing protein [Vicinamibacterales bacterium]